MNFTIFQTMALIGMVAGIAIVFALGYLEGRRRSLNDWQQHAEESRNQANQLRATLHQVRHDLDIQRHNAAQALEAMTEQHDRLASEAATLQLRLITAQERTEALQAAGLNDEAAEDLAAMAGKLSLAATQFSLMGATDQASSARQLAAKARDLSQRYYNAKPEPAQQQERAA